MTGIILAAGRGSRLGDLTQDIPKCMVTLGGRTLLEWQVNAMKGVGITRIQIVRGYLANMVTHPDVSYVENPRWATTGIAQSLNCASLTLRTDRCLVSYSDIAYRPHHITSLLGAKADIAIAYDTEWQSLWKSRFEDPLSDAETLVLQDDRVVEIGKKASNVISIQGQYMGLLAITPTGWSALERTLLGLGAQVGNQVDITRLLSTAIAHGVTVGGVPVRGGWVEVDSCSDLHFYQRMLDSVDLDGCQWVHDWR